MKAHYQRGGLGDMRCKQVLNDCLQTLLAPMRERRAAAIADKKMLLELLYQGTEQARIITDEVLAEVKKCHGARLLRQHPLSGSPECIVAVEVEHQLVQQALEPADRLVMGGQRVPRHQVDDRDGGVELVHPQRVVAAEVAPDHLGHHHQIAAGRHQRRHRHKARQPHAQLPLHPETGQPELHHRLTVTPAGGVDVGTAHQLNRRQYIGQLAAERRQADQWGC